MKFRLILLSAICVLSFSTNAKGIEGTYSLTGKAYAANEELIRNSEIEVEINGSKEMVETDSLGNYHYEVDYKMVCPSEFKGIRRRRTDNKINPKYITFKYADQKVLVKNKWRKYKSKNECNLDIRFKKADLLTIYEFGPYFDTGSTCERSIRAKYGFKTTWGTCIATKRMLRNNARVYRKIKRIHGYNWEERYEKEMEQCQ